MKMTSLVLAVSFAALLGACGKQESAAPEASAPAVPEAAAPAATAAPGPAMAEPTQGKSVFSKTCALCHAVGAAGAPKPGNKDEWGPRIAQGKDVLYKHALEGYTGTAGAMPKKGGRTDLTDELIKQGVDYIVSKAQ